MSSSSETPESPGLSESPSGPAAPGVPAGPEAPGTPAAPSIQALQAPATVQNAPIPKSRYVLSYVLWFFGGWFGLHRFYLGRWFTGLLYAGTFGFLGIGWLLDAFFIPKMVGGSSSPLVEEMAELGPEGESEGGAAPPVQILAPWAEEEKGSFMFRVQLFVGGLYLLLAPAIVVAFAILFDQWSLCVVMIGVLLFTNFLEQVRQVLETREEQVKRLPMMKSVIKHFNGFYEYYMVHRPRGFLFYLFYFPVGLITMIFSKLSREEGKLYMRVFAAIAAALIMGTLSSYRNVYGGYVPGGAIFGFLVANLIILFISVFFYVMPTMTTAFSYSLSGRRRSLKVLTFVSLILAVLIGAVGITNERGAVPILSRSVLMEKYKQKKFRKDFQDLAAMVLSWEVKRLPPQTEVWTYDEDIRTRFRRYVAKLAAGDQANAFHVLRFAPKPGQKPWLVLLLRTSREQSLLTIVAPKGQIYQSWSTLPPHAQQALLKTPLPLRKQDTSAKRKYRPLKPMLLNEFGGFAKTAG